MQTDELVSALAEDCTPVRPLAHPGWRAAIWFMVSVGYVVALVLVVGLRPDISAKFADWRFVMEITAAFLTSVTAAAAAFCAGCPGRPIWERFAPLPFLALWLGALGAGCWRDWLALGAEGLAVRQDLVCLPIIFAISIPPEIAIFAMIRRGAPLAPTTTMGLAALAATALAAAALRLFDTEDSSVMVLVWQFDSVALLTVLEAFLGRIYLRWPAQDEVLAIHRRRTR